MKLLNITYRLPVSFVQQPADDILIKLSSGGLVSALNSLPKDKYKMEWLGVADFSEKEWKEGEAMYEGDFELHPVFLTEKLDKDFYEGFSNSVLWPLFHYFPSFIDYSEEYFEAFVNANKQIADKACSLLEDDDIVWIHDYHLLPLSKYIRALHPNITIGFFLHTPFPSYELIRLLPKKCAQLIIDGMLGADVIGFQTYDYVNHFLDSAKHIAGLQHDRFNIQYEGRNIKVDAYPISIDYDKFNNAYDEVEVVKERNHLHQQYAGMKIIFSVDRLDYSKGIINRLRGYKRFLELHPEWHEKIVFILVLVPSRTGIKKYSERRSMIEELIGSINGEIGNYKWAPIVFQFSSLNYCQLLGLYTGCDIALISPLRDGMNLVAKEFVASRKNVKGVLMLSDLAGAASELSHALLFNPLDDHEIASNIYSALLMPMEEQEARLKAMQKQIRRHDVGYWADNFIGELGMHTKKEGATVLIEIENRVTLLEAFASAHKRLIVLDYDGTLTPFQPHPQLAVPSEEVIQLLIKLAANSSNEVVIASGRDKYTLDLWLGHLPIKMIAEHGAYIKDDTWKINPSGALEWKKNVRNIMSIFTDRCSGSFVEDKVFSLAWHYRNCESSMGLNKARELTGVLQSYLANTNTQILIGNKVIEVKPASINKGDAIMQQFDIEDYECCIVIGDDKTDEDMFNTVNEYNHAYTIKVGQDSSSAKFRVQTSAQVIALLHQLN